MRRIHGKLLTGGGGEGIVAVRINADSPDVRRGIAGELAILHGDVRSKVVKAGVVLGQGFQIGRIVNYYLVAFLQGEGFFDGVFEYSLCAVGHAALCRLDRESGVLRDGDRTGIGGIGTVANLIGDHSVCGGAGERDLCAGFDLAGGRCCRGGSHRFADRRRTDRLPNLSHPIESHCINGLI